MDSRTLKEMHEQHKSMERAYNRRLKKHMAETGMPEHWVRDILRAKVAVETLQANIAKKLGVTGKKAESLATEVVGSTRMDAFESIERHGLARWAFCLAYLTLRGADEADLDDSPYPAILRIASAANTLALAMEVEAKEVRAKNGAKGGRTGAVVTSQIRAEAIRLATETSPPEGWASAPKAADEIFPQLVEFAKERRRRPSRRKVEEWLRSAGIKRRPAQQ